MINLIREYLLKLVDNIDAGNSNLTEDETIKLISVNEHYHNCSELFKSWFGEDIDQKVIEAAILYWFKDDDCKSNSKLWNHFKEN